MVNQPIAAYLARGFVRCGISNGQPVVDVAGGGPVTLGAVCTNRNNPATCTGNPKVFGQGGWYDGPVVGPGAGQTVAIGEYFYRNVVACPFIGIDEPCIEDAGFVKLREISISYTLDAP